MENKDGGWLSIIIIIIGGFTILSLVTSAIDGAFAWFFSLKWYLSIPLFISAIFTIYKLGESKNWW